MREDVEGGGSGVCLCDKLTNRMLEKKGCRRAGLSKHPHDFEIFYILFQFARDIVQIFIHQSLLLLGRIIYESCHFESFNTYPT